MDKLPIEILSKILGYTTHDSIKIAHLNKTYKKIFDQNKDLIARSIFKNLGYKYQVLIEHAFELYKYIRSHIEYKHIINGPDEDNLLNFEECFDKAIRRNHIEIITLLMSHKNIKLFCNNHRMITLAMGLNRLEIFKILINYVDILNDFWGWGYLSYASNSETAEFLVMLLKKYPNIDPSHNGNSVLINAVRYDNIEAVKILIKDPRINPSFENDIILKIAARCGYMEMTKLLLEDSRFSHLVLDNYIFKDICKAGHADIAELMLKLSHIDPAVDDNFPIRTAVKRGHLELFKVLLADKRTNPAAHYNEPVRYAAKYGHIEILKILLTVKKVDPTAINNYAIRWALINDYKSIVKLLTDL